MKTRSLVVLAVLIGLAATVGIMLAQPSENVAAKGPNQGEVQLEFTVEIPVGDIPSSIDIPLGDIPSSVGISTVLDAVRKGVTNIGSSGEDGVRFDAFFDVFFEVEARFQLDAPCQGCTARTVQTEILSMSLSGSPNSGFDPGAVIESVRVSVRRVGGTVVIGHVTLIK